MGEQLRLKEERCRREAHKEQLLRERLMVKFAEDDRIEQMSAQRRRMRVQEHRREVDRQVDELQRAREAEVQQEREQHEQAKADEEWRRQVIEDEKKRLLNEYAETL